MDGAAAAAEEDVTTSNSEHTWASLLKDEKEKPYFKKLIGRVAQERESGREIFPPSSDVFAAMKTTPFERIKVVILGQDPYIQKGQAHGLSFSVRKGVTLPPSLVHIFKELHDDVGCALPPSGDLTPWTEEGVFLLNSILTVERGNSGSHATWGWQIFTDKVVELISTYRPHVVFLLWGAYAQKKVVGVDTTKHLLLKAAHPSPFSAHKGFFGCRHFSLANEFLISHGSAPINWCSLS
jgi:uracil-DNA glycosylase